MKFPSRAAFAVAPTCGAFVLLLQQPVGYSEHRGHVLSSGSTVRHPHHDRMERS